MNLVFSIAGAPARRLVLLTLASVLLLAADNVPHAEAPAGLTLSDEILAPMGLAEAATSAAALAATTPADVAAAAATVARRVEVPLEAPVEAPVGAFATLAPRPAALSTLIATLGGVSAAVAQDRELHCLANAVYFESRGEPIEGQLAVAQAILNRVESGRYASSICGVVNQPGQFSFDRSRTPRGGRDWDTAQAIAKIASENLWHDVAPQAMSFHATYVSPNWRGKTRVAQIGRHVFYK